VRQSAPENVVKALGTYIFTTDNVSLSPLLLLIFLEFSQNCYIRYLCFTLTSIKALVMQGICMTENSMTKHNEWLMIVKSKAVLIKLTAESDGCQGCNAALLKHLDEMWQSAGREITDEMIKYQNVWIEGYLQNETANINDAPSGRDKKYLNKLN